MECYIENLINKVRNLKKMRKSLIKYIICPEGKRKRNLEIFRKDKKEVYEGTLKCKKHWYPKNWCNRPVWPNYSRWFWRCG